MYLAIIVFFNFKHLFVPVKLFIWLGRSQNTVCKHKKVPLLHLFSPKRAKTSPLWEQREQRIMVVWRRLNDGINSIFSKQFNFFKIFAFWALWRQNMHTYEYWLVLVIIHYMICTRIYPIPWRCLLAEKNTFRLSPRNELLKSFRIHHYPNRSARVWSDSTGDRRCGSLYIGHPSTTNTV